MPDIKGCTSTDAQPFLPFYFFTLLLFRFGHVAFDVEAGHLNGTISAYGDGLFKMAWEFSLAIVGNLDLAFVTGLDRGLGVFRNSAAARGNGLIDDQRLFANVGIAERAGDHRILLRERTEVMGGLLELDLSGF